MGAWRCAGRIRASSARSSRPSAVPSPAPARIFPAILRVPLADQIVEQLGDRLPLILDAGDTGGMLASTIVRIEDDTWFVVREGAITEAEIRDAFGE